MFLILFVIVVATYSIFKYTKGIGLLPFGGRVLTAIPCSCGGSAVGGFNVFLTISPPVGGQFLYAIGTQAYLNKNLGFGTGMWALGLYTPGGVCMVLSPKGCSPLIPIGTITPTVGTSLVF